MEKPIEAWAWTRAARKENKAVTKQFKGEAQARKWLEGMRRDYDLEKYGIWNRETKQAILLPEKPAV